MTHLDTDKASLSSAMVSALGKEATFAKCLLVHSAKVLTKGPAGDLVAECHLMRSVKGHSLPSIN
jgi:hypothetical protein